MQQWVDSIVSINTPLAEANWKFRQIKPVNHPLLVCWTGYLTATPDFRHFLACTKLTGWKDTQFKANFLWQPDKFTSEATHDFLAVYQKVNQWKNTVELFRFQLQGNDYLAKKIMDTLTTSMINCLDTSSRYLLDQQSESIWEEIASVKLKELDTESLLLSKRKRKL